MKKNLLFLLIATAILNAQEPQGDLVEITVITRVMVEKNDAEIFINKIHEESKELSDTYANEKGVYSVELEVINETLIRSYSE